MIKLALSLLLFFVIIKPGYSEQFYVNYKTGNDANPGTKTLPLRTIKEAALRVNLYTEKIGDTILLSAGVHLLTETVLFNNNRFNKDHRLVIQAEIMPDDQEWSPQQMPIIVTVVPIKVIAGAGEEARGLEIETSHVTIAGLRFIGSPDYYYIDGKENRRSYPIWRDGKDLDDLIVTQCLFVGNTDVMPLRVAIIANGQGLVVDHCVFYYCENPVVFWNANGGSYHNAMRYCLVYGSHYSGVWTTKNTAEDFEFHHNIIAAGRAGWINENKVAHYQVHDCIFTGN